jgi:uncharacterized integral membrane protein
MKKDMTEVLNNVNLNKEQVYAKYILMARKKMIETPLSNRKGKLLNWLFCGFIFVIITTIIIVGVETKFAFDVSTDSWEVWFTIIAIIIALIGVIIIQYQKPKVVEDVIDIEVEAKKLISDQKKRLEKNQREMNLFPMENEL